MAIKVVGRNLRNSNKTSNVSTFSKKSSTRKRFDYLLPVFGPSPQTLVTFLIVAGGGCGGRSNGSGGGAGGFRQVSANVYSVETLTLTVGAGGADPGAIINIVGGNGTNSSVNYSTNNFLIFSATGGGGASGGSQAGLTYNGANGGSGGGGGSAGFGTIGLGNQGGYTPSEGNDGGNSFTGGGGGGAGAAANQSNAGIGAISTLYNGTSIYYAGGGAGRLPATSTGGQGGGGGPGINGAANTGGGGGGYTGTGTPGTGGSGIIFVTYTGAQIWGGGTVSTLGGNTVHTFINSGNMTGNLIYNVYI